MPGGHSRRSHGQALAEFALVAPIFVLVLTGLITLGLYVFYQQQVTNVAREAARWAALHSSTAIPQTTSWRDPQAPPSDYNLIHPDGPDTSPYPWPIMTEHARLSVWGVSPSAVNVNACWSGHVKPDVDTTVPDLSEAAGFPLADRPAVEDIGGGVLVANKLAQCRIGGIDPTASAGSLACSVGMTTPRDDPASDVPGNRVTVYACMNWSPPLAGFLAIPSSVTIRAVITEVIQRQQ